MEFPEFRKVVLIIIGSAFGFFVAAAGYLVLVLPDLSRTNRAIVMATGLGAVGTFALALATVYNVIQTNQMLESREREREKPLVIDELSHVIQPAIEALEANIQTIEQSHHDGCAFEWVYIQGPSQTERDWSPQSVPSSDSLSWARLAYEEPELGSFLAYHDHFVIQTAQAASQFHEEMKPEIERLLEEEEEEVISDLDQSLKVVTSAILKELEDFPEGHKLDDFWEKHREHLIDYAKKYPDVTLKEMKYTEEWYLKLWEDLVKKLKDRKAELKQDYRISEDDIKEIESDELRYR